MITGVQGIPPLVVTQSEKAQLNMEAGESNQQGGTEAAPDKVAAPAPKNDVEQRSIADLAQSLRSASADFLTKEFTELLDPNTAIQFVIDKKYNQMVFQLVDSQTQEVLRQLPAEDSLKIAKFISSQLGNGKITDARV